MKIRVKVTCLNGSATCMTSDGSHTVMTKDASLEFQIAGNDSQPATMSRAQLSEYMRTSMLDDWTSVAVGSAGVSGKVRIEPLDIPIIVRQSLKVGSKETLGIRDWLATPGKGINLDIVTTNVVTGTVQALSLLSSPNRN